MNKPLLILCLISLVACKDVKKMNDTKETPQTDMHHNQEKSEPQKKALSPHTSTMAMIGDAHIHIDYSSPGVRGRIIFGGLVGYDQVWQAGAHNATWIETNKDLLINDAVLPKGKYGFFTIPSEGEWTIMINKNWDQHGKDEYDEKDDVMRFKVTPEISEEIHEHLEYSVTRTGKDSGIITMQWERVKISIPFKIK